MQCPFCKEEIMDGAIKCKHCKSILDAGSSRSQSENESKQTQHSNMDTKQGYFEGLSAASFKTDKNCNTVFYPYGKFGKGRILSDEKKEKEVRKFVKSFLIVFLLACIGIGIAFGPAWSLLLLPIGLPWYYFRVSALVSGCSRSDEKLTYKESVSNSAAKHNRGTLLIGLIASIVFVVMGIIILIQPEASDDSLIGFAVTVFFGACACVFGYMLKVKR